MRRYLWVLIAIALAASAVRAAERPWFRDETARAELVWKNVNGAADQVALVDQNGQGIAVLDYDGDGWPDLFFPNGSSLDRVHAGKPGGPWALFRNRGDGTFEEVTERAGLDGAGWGVGAAAADTDNDGHADLYVTAYGPSQLYRNQGDGTFVRVPDAAGAAGGGWGSSAAFGDVDADGFLDLAVARYVVFDPHHQPSAEEDGRPCTYRGVLTGCGPWRWRGDGLRFYRGQPPAFTDATARAGLSVASDGRGFQVVLVDLDGDGDLDLYEGCDVMPNVALENDGQGRFRVNPAWGGLINAEGKPESAMGLAVADLDADGLPEILTTNFAGEKNTLYANRPPPAPQRLVDVSAAAGLDDHRAELDWGAALADFDLDGHQDALHVNGHIYPQVAGLHDTEDDYQQPPRLHAGGPRLHFREVPPLAPVPRWSARALAILDANRDGAPDAVVGVHNGSPRLLTNAAPDASRRGLTVELAGTRSSRDPLGARVTLEAAGTRQVRFLVPHQGFQGTQEARLFFAWPRAARQGHLTVRWPAGGSSTEEVRGPGSWRFVER